MKTKTIIGQLLNISMPILAWLAVNGHAPSGNLLKVAAVLIVPASLLALLVCVLNHEKLTPFPRWRKISSHISDAAIVLILTWHGWIWSAAAFGFGWAVCAVLFGAADELAKKKAQEP